jgi:hypothetical protein
MTRSATTPVNTARRRAPYLAATRDIAFEEAEMKPFHPASSNPQSTERNVYHFPSNTFSELTLAFLYRYGPFMDRHDLDTANVAKRTRSFEITNPDHPDFDPSFPPAITFSESSQARKLWVTTTVATWAQAQVRAEYQKSDAASLQ